MSIQLLGFDAHVINMRARMPFRYGIVSMTVCPHLFLRVEMTVNGKRVHGIAADHLPPKWFTKNPQSPFKDDVAEMMRMIRAACDGAMAVREAETVFDLWSQAYDRQAKWGADAKMPPLLWGFGVSLVERAMIEGFCRATGVTFADAVRRDLLGFNLARMYREKLGRTDEWLQKVRPGDLLPAEPLRSVISRHTVGLGDYLTDQEIPAAERLDDGLPQSLEACIRYYGLTHFKIKLSGDVQRDLTRLRRLAKIIEGEVGSGYAHTLDGNENFHQLDPFKALWEQLTADATLRPFLGKLIFVEQPLHRDVALSEAVKQAMLAWVERPPMIIDESDSSIGTMGQALESGYIGTSHKNCKGVFKSIANAMVIAHRRRMEPDKQYLLSGEDLSNVPPVALQQDLAVAATLGISHVERNGQHYFKGLTMLPADLQDTVLAHHGDLLHRHPRGFATLHVRDGRIDVGSLIDAPFGVGFELDPTRFTPMDQWDFASIENG